MSAEVPEAASAEEQKVSVQEDPGCPAGPPGVSCGTWCGGNLGWRARRSEAGLEPSAESSSRNWGGPRRVEISRSSPVPRCST